MMNKYKKNLNAITASEESKQKTVNEFVRLNNAKKESKTMKTKTQQAPRAKWKWITAMSMAFVLVCGAVIIPLAIRGNNSGNSDTRLKPYLENYNDIVIENKYLQHKKSTASYAIFAPAVTSFVSDASAEKDYSDFSENNIVVEKAGFFGDIARLPDGDPRKVPDVIRYEINQGVYYYSVAKGTGVGYHTYVTLDSSGNFMEYHQYTPDYDRLNALYVDLGYTWIPEEREEPWIVSKIDKDKIESDLWKLMPAEVQFISNAIKDMLELNNFGTVVEREDGTLYYEVLDLILDEAKKEIKFQDFTIKFGASTVTMPQEALTNAKLMFFIDDQYIWTGTSGIIAGTDIEFTVKVGDTVITPVISGTDSPKYYVEYGSTVTVSFVIKSGQATYGFYDIYGNTEITENNSIYTFKAEKCTLYGLREKP